MPIVAGVLLWVYGNTASAYDANDWPVHHTFGDGSDIALLGVYRYDVNDFSDDRMATGHDVFEDAHTNRRKEFGLPVHIDPALLHHLQRVELDVRRSRGVGR